MNVQNYFICNFCIELHVILIIHFTLRVSLSGSFHSVFTYGSSGDSAPPATVCPFFGLLHHGHAGNVVCFCYHRWTLQHSRDSLQAKWEVSCDRILFVPHSLILRHAQSRGSCFNNCILGSAVLSSPDEQIDTHTDILSCFN